MQTQRAKAVIGITVFATGAALAWRGMTVWSSAGKPAIKPLPAVMTGSALPASKNPDLLGGLDDVAFDIDPAALSIEAAGAEVERALRERGLEPPPGEPADVWRPRMQELARLVAGRMRAVWRVDADALESLSRQSGATREFDMSKVAPELRNMALSLGNMWKDQWELRPASSEVWVRASTYGAGFSNPFAPPAVAVRNPFRLKGPKPPPETLMHEALIPVKMGVEAPAGSVESVLLGIMYYWSEEEGQWRLYSTTVYHRHSGGTVLVGAPP